MTTEEFLLICGRNNLDEGLIKKGRALLEKGIDWELFIKMAMKSGMSFVFYNSLKKINCPEFIPEEFIDKLKIAYLHTISKATAQHRETLALLSALFEKGIPCVPLKGPILSKRLYGEIAARGLSTDIDLLVEEKDKQIAPKVLEEEGYSFNPGSGLGERIGQYSFGEKDKTAIDLHWKINPVVSSAERLKGFWEGARLEEDSGVHYYEFKEEELLLQLSAHLVDSTFLIQLRYVADINELLTRYKNTLDWESVIEKAKRWRLSNSLYAALILSRALFGTYVPDEVLAKLKPGFLKRILIRAFTDKKVILYPDSRRRRFMERFLKYILFQLLEAESLKDYLTIVFPPKDKMGQKTHLQRLLGGALKFMGGKKHILMNAKIQKRQ